MTNMTITVQKTFILPRGISYAIAAKYEVLNILPAVR